MPVKHSPALTAEDVDRLIAEEAEVVLVDYWGDIFVFQLVERIGDYSAEYRDAEQFVPGIDFPLMFDFVDIAEWHQL